MDNLGDLAPQASPISTYLTTTFSDLFVRKIYDSRLGINSFKIKIKLSGH